MHFHLQFYNTFPQKSTANCWLWVKAVDFSLSFHPAVFTYSCIHTLFHSLNNWICWLLMISKWHSMEYTLSLRVSGSGRVFFCCCCCLSLSHTPQNFRFNNSSQSKTTSFIDIKAMMWLSTVSIKALSPSLIWLQCIPLITHTVAMPLMKFWCCDHFAHRALNLQKLREKLIFAAYGNYTNFRIAVSNQIHPLNNSMRQLQSKNRNATVKFICRFDLSAIYQQVPSIILSGSIDIAVEYSIDFG